jgi:hypothetical protein
MNPRTPFYFISIISIILIILVVIELCILVGFQKKILSMDVFFQNGNKFFIDMDILIERLNNISMSQNNEFSYLRA